MLKIKYALPLVALSVIFTSCGGTEFHHHLVNHLKQMVLEQTISPEDVKLVLVTDDLNEALGHINTCCVENNLEELRVKRPIWLLGED